MNIVDNSSRLLFVFYRALVYLIFIASIGISLFYIFMILSIDYLKERITSNILLSILNNDEIIPTFTGCIFVFTIFALVIFVIYSLLRKDCKNYIDNRNLLFLQFIILTISFVFIAYSFACFNHYIKHESKNINDRYSYIDKILEDIEYEKIGTVIDEKADSGSEISAIAYKEIKYNDASVFDSVVEKISAPDDKGNDKCYKNEGNTKIHCYYGIELIINKDFSETSIIVTDSTSGSK